MQNQYELKHVFACLPRMERGAPVVIGGDPKGNNFLYTNGKCVIIRNIENPAVADIYTEHAHNVIVAKYAPSGFYIASGDAAGKIRIWDTTQKEHLLKYEYTPISGKIKDIAWTEDSKRICTAGEGREKFASVFLWDTGSSVGDVIGHSKAINSVDIRHKRPYRLVTGSDDTSVCFYEGPPFKFKTSIKDHSRFVNCIRYSPDGSRFVSASADGKILIFDGTTAEPIGSLGGEKAHNGGVYAVSWNADSSQLISASGDKTVKLWDVGAGTAVTTFNLGSDVSDQQLGCLWQNDHLLSISLSGYINYLDKNNPDRPIRTIKGHNKSIQCVTVHKCDDRTYIYSGSHDGHINYWDADSGDNDCFSGKGHTNQVNQLVASDTGELVTCSMDDTLRYTSTSKKDFSPSDVVKMDFQPRSVSVAPGGLSLAVCIGQVVLLKDNKKVFTLDKLDYELEVGTLHPDGSTAAIGSNGSVYLYSIQGNTLKDEGKTIKVKGVITDMAYSNDGAYLATVSTMKILSIFSVVEDYAVKDEFYGHHAKTVALAWSPDNQHIATAGMDMLVFVWTLGNGDKRIKIADAHRLHHVCGLAWKDEHTLITVAHDACVKQWTIRY